MWPKRLLNKRLIDTFFLREAKWSESHGATPGHLGGGLLYYSIVYSLRVRRCVCIGSGGGFVPRMIRQAQREMGGDRETHLIDADLPEVGWGNPMWLSKKSFFRKNFPDIILHLDKSENVLPTFEKNSLDYIHIDGDHSYEGCKADFELSLPLLAPDGVMTLHDTRSHHQDERCGVHRVVEEARAANFDVVDLTSLGCGVAIIRPRAA
jgi:hypothetical protein